jgi:hypothetical protein
MHLIEIFIPLADPDGKPFPPASMKRVREELLEMFGGVTMFSRAPAEGATIEDGKKVRDSVFVAEVMTAELDRGWWIQYRRELEGRFSQDEILIRASRVDRL